MSSPMSSTSVPSQNYSHQHGSYLDQLDFDKKHLEGFTDHISMNLTYSMHKSYALHQIHGSAAHESLLTEHLSFCHQTPPVQYTQHLNQGSGDPMIWLQPEQKVPAAQPQQIERQRVGEDVLVVQFKHPLLGLRKPRLHWTRELHARFVRAISELGDTFSARPKAILKKMNVKGLTTDQIKSHLQKYRTTAAKKSTHQGIQNSVNSHSPQLSGQGSSTSRSTAPVNGKGLESFQADIEECGKLLQRSETPNYYQNFMFAPMGYYQDKAMQTPNYFQNLLLAPMGDYGDKANGSNFGFEDSCNLFSDPCNYFSDI